MSGIDQPHFQDPEKAREYLEALRWPDGPVCPHCGSADGVYRLEGKGGDKGTKARPGLLKCRGCRKQFSVTVGTVFHRSKVPLHKWLLATYLLCSSKKGISSHQLHRTLGVTYKTAWFMAHRIREAMKATDPEPPMGNDGGVVEVDETFLGGSKRRRLGEPPRKRGYGDKMKVLTLVERNTGKARSFHVPRVNAATLRPILREHIAKHATVMTDDATYHDGLGQEFASHGVVRHSAREYAKGTRHSQTVEGFFGIFKRGITGVYQHVSEAHLHRYTTEFDFRYTHREVTDSERMAEALRKIEGRRLSYYSA